MWRIAKATGQNPEAVWEWDVEAFAWAEACEGYEAQEIKKQMEKHKK